MYSHVNPFIWEKVSFLVRYSESILARMEIECVRGWILRLVTIWRDNQFRPPMQGYISKAEHSSFPKAASFCSPRLPVLSGCWRRRNWFLSPDEGLPWQMLIDSSVKSLIIYMAQLCSDEFPEFGQYSAGSPHPSSETITPGIWWTIPCTLQMNTKHSTMGWRKNCTDELNLKCFKMSTACTTEQVPCLRPYFLFNDI